MVMVIFKPQLKERIMLGLIFVRNCKGAFGCRYRWGGSSVGCNYKMIYRWGHPLAANIRVNIDGVFIGRYYKMHYLLLFFLSFNVIWLLRCLFVIKIILC